MCIHSRWANQIFGWLFQHCSERHAQQSVQAWKWCLLGIISVKRDFHLTSDLCHVLKDANKRAPKDSFCLCQYFWVCVCMRERERGHENAIIYHKCSGSPSIMHTQGLKIQCCCRVSEPISACWRDVRIFKKMFFPQAMFRRSGWCEPICLEAAGSYCSCCDKSSKLSNAYGVLNLMIKKVINKT